jgi:D-alanyl-D-alanine carboxypeptidase
LSNALAFVSLKPNWDRLVSMSNVDEVGGGRLRVASGARLSVQDAFFSTVTASANNTANTLARISGLARKTYIARMNAQAKLTGATHSVFVEPSGMSEKNISTARDIALIADAAFRQPMIQRAASTASYHFTIRNTGADKTIVNTNYLLTQDPSVWVIGGKTGYLEESKYNLAVQLRAMDENGKPVYGKDIVVVVMGAPTKEGSFWSAKRMAQWAWNNHAF